MANSVAVTGRTTFTAKRKCLLSRKSVVLIFSLLGCSQPSRAVAPITSPPKAPLAVTADANVVALAPVATATNTVFSPWSDIDALPPGAIARIGSRRWLGDEHLAVTNDGTVTTYDDDIGLLQYRADGQYRRILVECSRYPILRSSGNTVFANCQNQTQLTVHKDDRIIIQPSDGCNYPRWSADQRLQSCADTNVVSLREASTFGQRWELMLKAVGFDSVVSNSGIVIVDTSLPRQPRDVVAIKDGQELWRRSGETFPVAIDELHQEVITFRPNTHPDGSRFYVYQLSTGKLLRTVGPIAFDVTEIRVTPDSAAWIVTLRSSTATIGQDDFVAKIDPKTAAILEQWDHGEHSAFSSDGRWAVFEKQGRLTHLNLSDATAARPSALSSLVPFAMAASHDGSRLAIVSQSPLLSGPYTLQTFDAKTLQLQASTILATNVDTIAFSTDSKLLTVLENSFELSILDAQTLAVRCTLKQPGISDDIYWMGSKLAIIDRGDEVDVRPGSITLMNDQCKQVRRHTQNASAFYVAHDAIAITVKWLSPVSNERNPKPDFTDVHWQTGKLTPARAHVIKSADEHEPRVGDVNRGLVSADGKTGLAYDNHRTPGGVGFQLRCLDENNNQLATVIAPDRTGFPAAIAGDGSWFALTDGPSVLIYPCRKK